mgnify:CR=1 FL=1
MGCFFGIIGVAIIWPASGYFLLCMFGWLGLKRQEKLLNWFKIPNYWLDKKIPFLKFKNSKPISNNFGNIIENHFGNNSCLFSDNFLFSYRSWIVLLKKNSLIS